MLACKQFMVCATALRVHVSIVGRTELFRPQKPNYPEIVLKHHKFPIIFDKF